jgi:hypothetical protein
VALIEYNALAFAAAVQVPGATGKRRFAIDNADSPPLNGNHVHPAASQ